MASNCIDALRSITTRANKPLSTSTKKSSFYWRGFKSHRGASKMSVVAARLARLKSHQQARPSPSDGRACQPARWWAWRSWQRACFALIIPCTSEKHLTLLTVPSILKKQSLYLIVIKFENCVKKQLP